MKRVWRTNRLAQVGQRAGVRVVAVRPAACEPTAVVAAKRLMLAAGQVGGVLERVYVSPVRDGAAELCRAAALKDSFGLFAAQRGTAATLARPTASSRPFRRV